LGRPALRHTARTTIAAPAAQSEADPPNVPTKAAMPDLSSLSLTFGSVRKAKGLGVPAERLVAESCRRARAAADAGIFTSLVPEQDAIGRAVELQKRAADGETLPLLGLAFAVKDNIHVAGMATTSNCPALAIMPAETAPSVRLLEEAGAVLVGKNTMDQFATGLNGTRSPEPLCRNAIDPAYIPGSETGGSGRVPAACNGIVGLKPTIGLVSSRGLLYNSRIFDCIPIFTRYCADAYEILELIAGYDANDPFSRVDAGQIDLCSGLPATRALAVPRQEQLQFFGDERAAHAFAGNLDRLRTLGFSLTEIDFGPFESAGRLVFQSAMVAERLCDYGDVITERPEAVDPSVRAAIETGHSYTAKDAFEAYYEMKRLQRVAAIALEGFAALVVPTVPTIYTIEEMLQEPMSRNTIMGTYTYFANPLNLCAVSVPGAMRDDGLPSALCFAAPAAQDGVLRAIAQLFEAGSLVPLNQA
jgi:allophanate hydrolase